MGRHVKNKSNQVRVVYINSQYTTRVLNVLA